MEQFIVFLQDNWMLSAGWAVCAVLLVYSFISPMLTSVKRVNNHQATMLINKQDAVILDIRAQKEFKNGHIQGARQIKPEEVREANFSKLEKQKNTPIIVVCNMGNLASGVANKLSKQGFSDVYVLDGGMNGWTSAGLPVSK